MNETPTDIGPFIQFIVTPLYKPCVIPSSRIILRAVAIAPRDVSLGRITTAVCNRRRTTSNG